MKRQAKKAKTPATKAAKVARAKKRRVVLAQKVQARTNYLDRENERLIRKCNILNSALKGASAEIAELRAFKAEHTPPPVVETPATEAPANGV